MPLLAHLCYRLAMPMLPARLLVLLALLAVPLTAPHAQPAACPQVSPGGRLPVPVNPRLAARTTLPCNDAYAALASGVTHGALWSAEHPTATSFAAAYDTRRANLFHPDARLPPADAAQLEDYRPSSFDRGHMTPSGDMPGPDAQEQSFSLANRGPRPPP